jgi:oxaloacetate decarboxylase (Na+ extruding) subunit alpha
MANIEFIDQTMRDGQQSLWGFRMRAYQAAPALPYIDRTGFRVVDLWGGGPLVVLTREFHDDPWATIDFLIRGLPTSSPRAGVRTLAVGGFGFTPDSIIDLWIRTLTRHGIESFWIFDCLYDMPVMKQKAEVVRAAGSKPVPAIMYGLTDLHTDAFFAERAKEMASWPGVETIYVEDASGILTPERAATLLPALQAATGDVRLELHCHNTTGLASLVYAEGLRCGIDILHTCSLPMANGPSLPSTEATIELLTELGHTHSLDESQLPPVAEHFARAAKEAGYAIGTPNEYRALPYKHQLPGGMTGTLTNQLAQHDMLDRMHDVIEEIVVVRSELGEPIMATPFSQFVGIQAVLNIVLGERYKVVPDEVIQYALGHFGPLLRPVEPEVLDRLSAQPRWKLFEEWERPNPSLADLRSQIGRNLSDEELILRVLVPPREVDAMLAAGPLRTTAPGPVSAIKDLVAHAGTSRRFAVSRPGLSVDLRRH